MQYENAYIKMMLVDGILHAYYKPGIYVDITVAKNIVAERKKLTKGIPHAALVVGGPIEMSAEARKYALTKESSENIVAWAIIADQSLFKSVFLKLLFFTQGKWNKIRFFDNEEEGLKWLKPHQTKLINVQSLN